MEKRVSDERLASLIEESGTIEEQLALALQDARRELEGLERFKRLRIRHNDELTRRTSDLATAELKIERLETQNAAQVQFINRFIAWANEPCPPDTFFGRLNTLVMDAHAALATAPAEREDNPHLCSCEGVGRVKGFGGEDGD